MCLALYDGFLDFSVIIAAVLSYNNFVGPCIENTRSSRMEEIYFSALYPETAAINSDPAELVATVTCILFLFVCCFQSP